MKRLLLTFCLAATVFTATACTAPPSMSGGSSGSEGSPVNPASPPLSADKSSTVIDQQIVTSGSMTVRTDRPADALADAVRITESAGGRVASRTEQAGSDRIPPSANASLRIPSDTLDGAIEKLKGLGTVGNLTLNRTDVGQQAQDLDARIAALRTSVGRLTTLLASATTTADLVSIESSLTQRQADLDSLVAQRAYLADQVDYATLELTLVSSAILPQAGPGDFWGGLTVGWNSLIAFFTGAVVVFGVALPWLGLLALMAAIALVIVLVVRATRPKTGAGL